MTKADDLRDLASRLEVPATVAIKLRKIAVDLDQMAEALRPLANMARHHPLDGKFRNRPTSGEVWTICDSAGTHSITVEDMHAAAAALRAAGYEADHG